MTAKSSFLAESGRERVSKFRSCLRRASRRPEEKEIHDLRVSIRRLLAFLSVAGVLTGRDADARKAAKRLRDLMTPLGRLRDAQVKIEWLKKIVPEGDEPTYFYALSVLEDAYAWKERVGVLLRGIDRARFADPAGSVARSSRGGKTVRSRAAAILERREREIGTLASAARDVGNPEALHRMRLAFKKYRYSVEVLALLFPRITARTLARLHAFQTLLGNIHDLDVMFGEAERFRYRVLGISGECGLETRTRAFRRREFARLAPLIASREALSRRVFAAPPRES